MASNVAPGEHLTRQPSPRVLVYLSRLELSQAIAERLASFVPTVRAISHAGEVNLNEWDVLITREAPLVFQEYDAGADSWTGQRSARHYDWKQRYPKDLCVLYLFPSDRQRLELVDAWPGDGSGTALPPTVIVRDPPIAGEHLRRVDGLPESLSTLIGSTLAPAARKRDNHGSIRRHINPAPGEEDQGALEVRPFLLGPEDCVIAGSYERSASASVWCLPDYCTDISSWLREALREWHSLYPIRFPALPDWHGVAAWRSTGEQAVVARMEAVQAVLAAAQADHDKAMEQLRAEFDDEQKKADGFERALLTSDGDELVDAVACALADLGFHVTDMDEHWPENDRREDLRVFIDGDPDWVGIVEVKGFTKGVKETELQAFGRWAERFILDHGRIPDARWFIANHDRRFAPGERAEPFTHKPAIVETFAQSGGLVIDTLALFDALNYARADAQKREQTRDLLQKSTGLLFQLPE